MSTNNKKINQNNDKRERFIRIAEKRVNNILNNLDSLGKCSNRKNYEYNQKDVKKIFSEIDKKTREIKQMYQSSGTNKNKFRLEG
jgi:hypothetical protein